MGQWHKPWQVGIIINKMKQDWSSSALYEYELMRGWTDANERKFYWNNTKHRIFNLTNKYYLTFVQPNSRAYVLNLKYHKDMENKFKKDSILYDNLKDIDKDDLITIIQILREELEKERKEKTEKSKRTANAKMIGKIVKNTRRKCSQRKLCLAFSLNRKTIYNYCSNHNHGNVYRSDFKHNRWYYKNAVISLFYEMHQCQGAFKLAGILNKEGISISIPCVRRILQDAHLYPCSIKNYHTPNELKDTTHKREYLLRPELLQTYKPGEAFSADFMYLWTSEGIKYVHGIIDVISHEVVSLKLIDKMTAECVYDAINDLPSTAKVLNTDYGTQYFEKNVQELLKIKNIKHSCGKPGKSTDNGWIERFWRRLRGEWLIQHQIDEMSLLRVKQVIDEYSIFWNYKRVISTLNWQTPHNYAITWMA